MSKAKEAGHQIFRAKEGERGNRKMPKFCINFCGFINDSCRNLELSELKVRILCFI